MKRVFIAAILLVCVVAALAQQDFFMPQEQFVRFRNKRGPKGEGSCVYASISMCGAHHGVPSAEYLLENHPTYGPAVLDGSWPERVERDMASRRVPVPIWNVEGSQTPAWIDWALDRGCYVAITYGQAHMIAAVGRSDGDYFIVDNNFPQEIRRVSRDVFLREHRRHGGGWCVILRTAGPPPWTQAEYPRRPR